MTVQSVTASSHPKLSYTDSLAASTSDTVATPGRNGSPVAGWIAAPIFH